MTSIDEIEPQIHSTGIEIGLDEAISKLVAYCRANDWGGYDPYDALNSPILRSLRFLDHRIPRLLFTQALKRSPFNFRSMLRIPKTQNPKALALFLSSFLKLEGVSGICCKRDVDTMIQRLRDLRSPGTEHWCWGYSFPWQTRTVDVPSGAPNLVCTTFVANALFDAADRSPNPQCLNMALSATEYILANLYWDEGSAAGFSYPAPALRSHVHNANFLASALLCRAYKNTGDEGFLLPALRVARYSATKQRADGSWFYGEAPSQAWIDNFHTGYNLCALEAISRHAATTEFEAALHRGFEFYRKHFFNADGSVSYFYDRHYPIDVHCVAQSILTLLQLKEMDSDSLSMAWSVLRWALTHLWDERGYFYYRILKSHTNRLSFMRWSQAWMLLAMATLLEASGHDQRDEANQKRTFSAA